MTLHTMSPDDLKAFEQQHAKPAPTCSRCKKPTSGYGEKCQRCARQDNIKRTKMARVPTDAQRATWAKGSKRLSTLVPTPVLEGECRHHWLIPSLPDSPGLYVATCKLCGEQKEHRPWAFEDAGRKGP